MAPQEETAAPTEPATLPTQAVDPYTISDQCQLDDGFVHCVGTVVNNTEDVHSYNISIELRDSNTGVRLDLAEGYVFDVKPGDTAQWTADGTANSDHITYQIVNVDVI